MSGSKKRSDDAQFGINPAALAGLTALTFSESFDEPLRAQTVRNVLRPFLGRPVFLPRQGIIPDYSEGESLKYQ